MNMQEPGLPEIKLETESLYREEVFTDRRAGTVRRMTPCYRMVRPMPRAPCSTWVKPS